MESSTPAIRISREVLVTPEQAWTCWTQPAHIMQWNFAHPSWCCPAASIDLRQGGSFSYRMEARDGSFGFDFGGSIEEVVPMKKICCLLGDGRRWEVEFVERENGVAVIEVFEPESVNPVEMQQAGWQSILDNFGRHAEEWAAAQGA